MEGRSKISINILNYNTYEKSKKCIESCLQQKNVLFSVLLIDNCSTDDSLQKLKNEFGDRILYLENKENYGYAKGNNLGVQYCHDRGIDYSLLLNSDIVLNSTSLLDKLVEVLKNSENCAVVAPLIYNVTAQGLELNCNDSQYLRMLRIVGILPKLRKVSEEIETISEAQGSALLVNNEIFLKVGGFPEHYFMYGEESSFAKKILWSGYDILWYKNHDKIVLHYHDKTAKVDPWRLYLMGRNRALEYYENKNRAPFRWLFVFYSFIFVQALEKNWPFLKGVKTGRLMHVQNTSKADCFLEGKNAVGRVK